jgi:hypothetical protein
VTILRKGAGTGHSYRIDGRKVPGVTTILRMMPKDALAPWHGRVTAEYAVNNWERLTEVPAADRLRELERAANTESGAAAKKGTLIHRLAERIATLPEGAEIDFVPEELMPYVDSYLAFLDEHKPEVMATELVVASRRPWYCGTADLVAQLLGWTWLLEVKTGKAIYRESALQACAYSRATSYTLPGEGGIEHPLAGLGIERCGALHIRADGYDLYPLDTSDEVWAYFRRLAWCQAREDATREWVGEAVERPLLRAAS